MTKQQNYNKRNCAICLSDEIEAVIDLNASPIADAYSKTMEESLAQAYYPLVVNFCGKCGHLQLSHHLPTDILFENYTYCSSISTSLLEHFKSYAGMLIERFNLDEKSFVVDIGSNDGSFLQNFAAENVKVLGIDPAKNITKVANEKGIPTICENFDTKVAKSVVEDEGHANLITANNVFAHISDLHETVEAVEALLSNDGIFIFEVSYMPDIVNKKLFDTIYHEHLFYYCLSPLTVLFEKFNLQIFDYDRLDTKGGSIRVYVRKNKKAQPISGRLSMLLQLEVNSGFGEAQRYRDFNSQLVDIKDEILDTISKIKMEGLACAGYGASATVTTLVHYLGLSQAFNYILDDNVLKHGLYLPGTDIKVYDSSNFFDNPAEVVCVLAWNHRRAIINNNPEFKTLGASFLVPLPSIELH